MTDQQQTSYRDPGAERVARAAKGYVANLALDQRYSADPAHEHPFTFWFRPGPIRETQGASYTSTRVLGMPHAYQVYEGGENVKVTFQLQVHRDMLFVDLGAQTGARPASALPTSAYWRQQMVARMQRGRRYLQALLVPPALTGGMVGGSPPACLLVIPGILALRARLLDLSQEYTDVDTMGELIAMNIDCTFEEAPLRRVTMQDVLAQGSNRTWGLV